MGGSVGGNTLPERAHRLFSKGVLPISLIPRRLVEIGTTRIMTNPVYIALDKKYAITEKVCNATLSAVCLATNNYKRVRYNVIEPSMELVKTVTDKTKNQVTVVLQGLNVPLLKANYNKLHYKYEVLQKCVVIVAGETVKLVFDKEALAELSENSKKEISRLYQELKTMEKEKIKNVGLEYYTTVLKKAQQTYETASESVAEQKKVEAVRN